MLFTLLTTSVFVEQEHYRNQCMTDPGFHEVDKPFLVQFCGNDPDTLVAAAKYVDGKCDGVDLNLGCPQGVHGL